MKTWTTKKLGEVCEKVSLIKAPLNSWPYIEIGDINLENKAIIFKVKKSIKGAVIAPKDSVLVSRVRPTRGAIVFIDKNYVVSSAFTILKAKKSETSSRFLFHWLSGSKGFLNYLQRKQKGSNYPSVREKDIFEFKIFLPLLEIQKQIVERLDKIIVAQKLNDELIQKSDELFQSLLHQELNSAGKNWEVKKLKEICEELFAGGDVPKNNFSKIKTDRYFVPIFANGIQGKDLYGYTDIKKVTKPSITISARGTIGYSAIRTEAFYPIVRLIVIIPNPKIIDLHFLYYTTRNLIFFNTGTSIPQLTIPMIENIKIHLPFLETQKQIAAKLSVAQEYKTQLLAQKSKLKELFDSVLNKSMKGELEEKGVMEEKGVRNLFSPTSTL